MTEKFKMIRYPESGENFLKGRLLGGCLDCLAHLVGTRFDHVTDFVEQYAEDGIIWFLEACELNVFEIRRALWNLKEAGWFNHVKGFLIGRPGIWGESVSGLDQYTAVTGVLGEFGVPILMDLDIGHVAPMMPLISGAMATVKADSVSLQIQMELI